MRFLLAALTAAWIAAPVTAQQLSDDEIIEFAAQSLCLGADGRTIDALPIEDSCGRFRPQRINDKAVYRKHDWPNELGRSEIALGYQASDSVVLPGAPHPTIIQTFDFGTGDRRFGQFDGAKGDGGQVMMLIGHWATFPMTEDGSGGIQWFVGEGCQTSPTSESALQSWLVFGRDVSTRWQSTVAKLNIVQEPNRCPRDFNSAYTRYRLTTLSFPFRLIHSATRVEELRHPLKVVVSEHYGGATINSADHLERFVLAKGLGLIRWERWANGSLRQPNAVREMAVTIAGTARCPAVMELDAPGRNWFLVDCRTWTALVRQGIPWSVEDYGWTALKRLETPR